MQVFSWTCYRSQQKCTSVNRDCELRSESRSWLTGKHVEAQRREAACPGGGAERVNRRVFLVPTPVSLRVPKHWLQQGGRRGCLFRGASRRPCA